MKLEPVFKVHNNKVFFIADQKEVDFTVFKMISISWAQVEIDDEVYNEEFLAKLRDDLKLMESKNEFAILVPQVDKTFESSVQKEAFINTMNHTARRVKDCVSVAGFALPSQLLAAGLGEGSDVQNFIDVISKKHAQYIYFASKSDVTAFNLTEKASESDIVLY